MKIILLSILITINFTLFSQEYKWASYKTLEDVNIYYSKIECHDYHNGIHKELIIFKFENKTDKNLEISWDFSLEYSNAKNEYSSEQHRDLILKKASTIYSDCYNYREYSIFSRFLNYKDKSELIDFELSNITIKELKL